MAGEVHGGADRQAPHHGLRRTGVPLRARVPRLTEHGPERHEGRRRDRDDGTTMPPRLLFGVMGTGVGRTRAARSPLKVGHGHAAPSGCDLYGAAPADGLPDRRTDYPGTVRRGERERRTRPPRGDAVAEGGARRRRWT